MGNNNSNTADIVFDTDEKRQAFVDKFYETTQADNVIKWKQYKFPIDNPVEMRGEDGAKLATYKFPKEDGT